MSDDFDIYEDLNDLELQVEKESQELQDLREKITVLEAKLLVKEEEKLAIVEKNNVLLANISSLLLTAKAEIKRKDTIISDLRKQGGTTGFRHGKHYAQEVRRTSKRTQTAYHGHVHVGVQVEQREVEEVADRKRKCDDMGRDRDRERDRSREKAHRESNCSRERYPDKTRDRQKDRDKFHERDRSNKRHRDRSHVQDGARDQNPDHYRGKDSDRERHRYDEHGYRSREYKEDSGGTSVQARKKDSRHSVESHGSRSHVRNPSRNRVTRSPKHSDNQHEVASDSTKHHFDALGFGEKEIPVTSTTAHLHKDEGITRKRPTGHKSREPSNSGIAKNEPCSEKVTKTKTHESDVKERIQKTQAKKCRAMYSADAKQVLSKVDKYVDHRVDNNTKTDLNFPTRQFDNNSIPGAVCEKFVSRSTCAAPIQENCTSLAVAEENDAHSISKPRQNLLNNQPSNTSECLISNELPLIYVANNSLLNSEITEMSRMDCVNDTFQDKLKLNKESNGAAVNDEKIIMPQLNSVLINGCVQQDVKEDNHSCSAAISLVPSGSKYQDCAVRGGGESAGHMSTNCNTYLALNEEALQHATNQSMNILDDEEEMVSREPDVRPVDQHSSPLAKDEISHIKTTEDVSLNEVQVVKDSSNYAAQYTENYSEGISFACNDKFGKPEEFETKNPVGRAVATSCATALNKSDNASTKTKVKSKDKTKCSDSSHSTHESKTRSTKNTNIKHNGSRATDDSNRNKFKQDTKVKPSKDKATKHTNEHGTGDTVGQEVTEDVKKIYNMSSKAVDNSERSHHISTAGAALKQDQFAHRLTNKVDPENVTNRHETDSTGLTEVSETMLISKPIPKSPVEEDCINDTNVTATVDNDGGTMISDTASITDSLNAIEAKPHKKKTVKIAESVSDTLVLGRTLELKSPTVAQGVSFTCCEEKDVDCHIEPPSANRDRTNSSQDLPRLRPRSKSAYSDKLSNSHTGTISLQTFFANFNGDNDNVPSPKLRNEVKNTNTSVEQPVINSVPSSNHSEGSGSIRDRLWKKISTKSSIWSTLAFPGNNKRRLSVDSLPTTFKKHKSGIDQHDDTRTFSTLLPSKLLEQKCSSILLPIVSSLDSINLKTEIRNPRRANLPCNSNLTPMVVVHSPAKSSERSAQQNPVKNPPILESSFDTQASVQTIMDSLTQTEIKSEECDQNEELEDLRRNDCNEMDTTCFSPQHLLASSTPLNAKPKSRLRHSADTVAATEIPKTINSKSWTTSLDHPTPAWSSAAVKQWNVNPITNIEDKLNRKVEAGVNAVGNVAKGSNEQPRRLVSSNDKRPVPKLKQAITKCLQSSKNKKIVSSVGSHEKNSKPSSSVTMPKNGDALMPVEESTHYQPRAVFKTPDVIKSSNRLKHTPKKNTLPSDKFSWNDSHSTIVGMEQTVLPSEKLEQLQMNSESPVPLKLCVKQESVGLASEPSTSETTLKATNCETNSANTSPIMPETRSVGTPLTSRKRSSVSKSFKRGKLEITREEEIAALIADPTDKIKKQQEGMVKEGIQPSMAVRPTTGSVVAEGIVEENGSQSDSNVIENSDLVDKSQDSRAIFNGENVLGKATRGQGSDAFDATTRSPSLAYSCSTSTSSTVSSTTSTTSADSFITKSPIAPTTMKPESQNLSGSVKTVKQTISQCESMVDTEVHKIFSVVSSVTDPSSKKMCNFSLNLSLANAKPEKADTSSTPKPEAPVRFVREMRIVKENPKLMRVYIRRKGV